MRIPYWFRILKGDGGFGKNRYVTTCVKSFLTPITGRNVVWGGITLTNEGFLRILAGYIWDGPSGPTHDSEWNMAASLAHDAGYDLIKHGGLSMQYRKVFDLVFYRLLLRAIPRDAGWFKRKFMTLRAWYYYRAVRLFGGRHAK